MMKTLRHLRIKAPVPPANLPTKNYRINSIDFLRGLVMIIMALDHTRDYFHETALTEDPLNFATTTPALFLTRWITHFCAPVFVFLAGTAAFFQGQRKTKAQLSSFLLKRGVWLILTELTLVGFGITFDVHFSAFFLQVIWAIGISMVWLGLAVWLPLKIIFTIGLLIVLGHNLLDYYEAGKQQFSVAYSLLHRPNFIPLGSTRLLGVLYPFLPWTGLMFLGYCFGRIFTQYEGARRRKVLALLGTGIVVFFIALRATNSYGDPAPWAVQKTGLFTVLSFVNTTKYPPSLLYTCMTIGPAILFLAAVGSVSNRFSKIVTVYGRVPFFYYILHFYLLHTLLLLSSLTRHSFADGAAGSPGIPFKFVFPGEGYFLAVTYLIWIGVVAVLYPACQWFSRYKQTHKQWWLSYL